MRAWRSSAKASLLHPVGVALAVSSVLIAALLTTMPWLSTQSRDAPLVLAAGLVAYLACIGIVTRWPRAAARPRGARPERHRPERSTVVYPSGLTHREVEVLRLLADDLANKEIARALGLSVPTVERHIANIYAKIGAHGRGGAVAYALRHGLCEPEPSPAAPRDAREGRNLP